MEKRIAVKIDEATRQMLKVIAALEAQTQYAVLARLVRVEYDRLTTRDTVAHLRERPPS